MISTRSITAAAITVAVGGLGVIAGTQLSSSQSGGAPVAPAASLERVVRSSDQQASPRPAVQQGAAGVYARSKDAVVFIQSQTDQGVATGSGFVITADGLIVTNAHVVAGSQAIQVKIGPEGAPQSARIVGGSLSTDLALLRVDGAQGLAHLPLAAASPQVGETVFAIGSPYGLAQTLTEGIISATGRDIEAPSGATISGALQTDAAINPGNSGGPLLNLRGEVVGVNSQITAPNGGGNVGIGFAISVPDVLAQISDAGEQIAPQSQAGADTPVV
ncbi:unannotated protein [freshwater metagenome]|uniref:Unannotated protein n=1 Tax=freshwater metagenome TaxID=449393 RepID=A0A6J7D1V0_9ZZZZ|nr:trypsin-like serine protease [Actinomycetota bacterium]